MPDLLIELFSEEIPARMQARAREDLRKLVTDGLVVAGLTYASAGAFSTPRRLVLSVEGLSETSQIVREEKKGPSIDANPQAIAGYLRGLGMEAPQSWYQERIEALRRGEVISGEHGVVYVQEHKGKKTIMAAFEYPAKTAAEIVGPVLETTIRNFPWPKSMRWGSGTLRWVRPLQTIICLLSDKTGAHVVPLDVDGIVAGNTTEGHRFMGNGRFTVHGFDDYVVKLRRAKVMLDTAEREAAIWQDAQNQAFAAGMEVVPDAGLLAEVAGLVEWPVPLMGRIGEAFLGLPPEVLQTSMKEHQKFFSVKNPKTGRIEGFVTVANIEAADGGEVILKGNQKVLAARLSDAKFFWENDLRVAKGGMGEWVEGLKSVTFQAKLGSQAERIDRIAALAREIAPLVGADAADAERAARLAKLDLRSAMVGEFPELQGVMGRYYALEAGEKASIADAARDHWRPKGESDSVPAEPVSVAVALADKIDTLTGFWAIDEKPTGSKDPFALRRAEIGTIRLLLANNVRHRWFDLIRRNVAQHQRAYREKLIDDAELQFDIAIRRLRKAENLPLSFPGREVEVEIAATSARSFERAFEQLKADHADAALVETAVRIAVGSYFDFREDRLKVFLKDQGIRHDIIDACLAMPGNDDLTLLVKRAEALAAVMKTEDGANLLQGYKRAANILTQAEAKDGVEYSYGAEVKFAETDEERALFAALDRAEATITPAMAKEDFATAMAAMASLRAPVDAFFTAVQVNSDNPIIRRNRLNLLSRIRAICSGVADLSRIEG